MGFIVLMIVYSAEILLAIFIFLLAKFIKRLHRNSSKEP